jgi:hypothetical protein
MHLEETRQPPLGRRRAHLLGEVPREVGLVREPEFGGKVGERGAVENATFGGANANDPYETLRRHRKPACGTALQRALVNTSPLEQAADLKPSTSHFDGSNELRDERGRLADLSNELDRAPFDTGSVDTVGGERSAKFTADLSRKLRSGPATPGLKGPPTSLSSAGISAR